MVWLWCGCLLAWFVPAGWWSVRMARAGVVRVDGAWFVGAGAPPVWFGIVTGLAGAALVWWGAAMGWLPF